MCPGWPQTKILLISASQVARMTGMSYWCPAELHILKEKLLASAEKDEDSVLSHHTTQFLSSRLSSTVISQFFLIEHPIFT
jgi:hypothetical protein